MHAPNGGAMPNEGVVLAFETNCRFVFADAFTMDWRSAGPLLVGVFEVEPDGDGTRYRASARHWTHEAMEKHRRMRFEQVWCAAADQLQALAK